MKTHIVYISLILLLVGVLFAALKWGQMRREESRRKGENITALRSDTTEKAITIRATRKELRTLFVQKDRLIRAFEKAKGGKVREVHTMALAVGSIVIDSSIKKYPITTLLYDPRDTFRLETVPYFGEYNWQSEPIQFYFPHGCLSSIVDYDPLNGVAQDSLFGEVEINRYIIAEKPRWIIFKPRMWNSKNWPTSVRVENNCGLIIRENTILQIK